MPPDKPDLKWVDFTLAWRTLSPLYRRCFGVIALTSTLGWLILALFPIVATEWWLAHNQTAFRLNWLTLKTIAWLISMICLCGFCVWTRKVIEKRDKDTPIK